MSSAVLPRICFVIPYFGKWPFWMPFFIESCRANPSIDWLMFSDCGEVEACPSNVRIIHLSYAEYCDQVSARLGIDFHPVNAYKLCDLKPALGHVHQEHVAGYDFWAFGDIDLVYGDLRNYFTPERLANRDLLATHERRISGHCCLLRNTEKMTKLFMQVEGWQHRLADDAHQAFDESAFSRLFIRYKNWPPAIRRFALNLTNPRFRAAEFVEAYSTPNGKIAWHDGTDRHPERWFWRAGVLTNDRDGARSFPYLHFMFWKKQEWHALTPEVVVEYPALARSGAWQVSASGFAPL